MSNMPTPEYLLQLYVQLSADDQKAFLSNAKKQKTVAKDAPKPKKKTLSPLMKDIQTGLRDVKKMREGKAPKITLQQFLDEQKEK